MQQQKGSGSEKEKHPSSNKKSRHNSWSGNALAVRSNNFSNPDNAQKASMPGNKSTKYKVPEGSYVLIPQEGISVNEMIVDPPFASNIMLWKERVYDYVNEKYGSISNEINGIPYVPMFPPPDQPNPGANVPEEARRGLWADYSSDRAASQKESKEIFEKRSQIYAFTQSKLDEPLRLLMKKQFPNMVTQPNIIEYFAGITEQFALSCFGGKKQLLHSQILTAYASFYSGEFAFNNAARHQGKLNLHEHFKEYGNLLTIRRALGFEDLSDIDQAIMYIRSTESIDMYILPIADLNKNENTYENMPKATAAQRAKANEMREMPTDVSKAHQWLQNIIDYGVSFNKKPSQSNIMFQSSSISKYEGRKSKKTSDKGKTKEAETVQCTVCSLTDHTSDKCPKFKEYAEQIKKYEKEKAEKQSKKQTQSSNYTEYTSEYEDDEVEEVLDEDYNCDYNCFSNRAFQRSAYVIEKQKKVCRMCTEVDHDTIDCILFEEFLQLIEKKKSSKSRNKISSFQASATAQVNSEYDDDDAKFCPEETMYQSSKYVIIVCPDIEKELIGMDIDAITIFIICNGCLHP